MTLTEWCLEGGRSLSLLLISYSIIQCNTDTCHPPQWDSTAHCEHGEEVSIWMTNTHFLGSYLENPAPSLAQLCSHGASFSKAPETFRACKAIFSLSVSKKVYEPGSETSCMKGTSVHIKNT